MRKLSIGVIAAALVGAVAIPQVSGTETLLRKVEYRGFEAYLPQVTAAVPWLNLDKRMKFSKGDYPIGREVDSVGPLVFQPDHIRHADLAAFALGGS